MSVSRAGKDPRRRKRGVGGPAGESRRGAVKDAMPDTQPPERTKRIREEDQPEAESDEEDD